mmetsp:Transcript_45501/g.98553  ORF Transcript_45501/g.98553 Transcript_45501/m.98553 type:complete len:221 (+) Transcript_45501:560-1222(+)
MLLSSSLRQQCRRHLVIINSVVVVTPSALSLLLSSLRHNAVVVAPSTRRCNSVNRVVMVVPSTVESLVVVAGERRYPTPKVRGGGQHPPSEYPTSREKFGRSSNVTVESPFTSITHHQTTGSTSSARGLSSASPCRRRNTASTRPDPDPPSPVAAYTISLSSQMLEPLHPPRLCGTDVVLASTSPCRSCAASTMPRPGWTAPYTCFFSQLIFSSCCGSWG